MQPAANLNDGLLPWVAGLGLSLYLWVKFPRLMNNCGGIVPRVCRSNIFDEPIRASRVNDRLKIKAPEGGPRKSRGQMRLALLVTSRAPKANGALQTNL
jgi:hypothetical protein